MLEEIARFTTDEAATGPVVMGDGDGLDFLPELLASLSGEGLEDAEIVTQLQVLESLTSAAAAAKVVLTEALHRARCASDATAGCSPRRQGRGVAHEVGLARRISPARARKQVRLALILTRQMPAALAALRAGELSEEKAMILAVETPDLDPAARTHIDSVLASRYGDLSSKALTMEVRRLVTVADPQGAEKRARAARERRHVTCRSIGDGMARITGQIPALDAISAMDSLREHAQAQQQMGQKRSRSQLLADAFTDRLQADTFPAQAARTRDEVAGTPADSAQHRRGVEIQLVMNADMLLGHDTHTPAHLPGHGPIPIGLVKDLLADADLDVFIRRLYAHPEHHTLVAMDSASTLFRGRLRRLLFAREDHTCRTPGCDAPLRHGDHVRARHAGGTTTLDGGQGLCEDCNYTKEQPGWRHRVMSTWPDPHHVEITTPTGHTHHSHAPPLPIPPTTTQPATTQPTITGELYPTHTELVWEPHAA